ncbi:MAG: threonine--tRNA ligase [Oscillospiraceae bacterium]|nr:threonine--tRNA ligase [Oscillospiraceae bacterium]
MFKLLLQDGQSKLLPFDDAQCCEAFRHTAAHVLAQAVKRSFPNAKLAMGPAIENGFYYDFDVDTPFSADDLAQIEKTMKAIIKEGATLETYTLSADEARTRFAEEPYKLELINELADKGEALVFYSQGSRALPDDAQAQSRSDVAPEFEDLCCGPHLARVSDIKAFKLLSATGAYWRGSEKNKMLCRIYGTAFPKAAELEAHLAALDEAKKRDHNKLGRELELFTTSDVIGQGLPVLMPKGAKIVQILQRWIEDLEEQRGYVLTKTPSFAKADLYKISGHYDRYWDGMFKIGKNEDYALRPMTCPFQFQAYLNGSRTKSYRDLPIRYNETATLFRNESSGEMHGLIRLRQFTLAEGHIVCTPEQVEDEFFAAIDLIKHVLEVLGLSDDVHYRFSKWDENNRDKYIGEPEQWESMQAMMRTILDKSGLDYVEADGEAAFYGPKLDMQMRNVYGKEDTLFTVQIDFQLAEKFGMVYTDSKGDKQFPIIIHRSSIGCYERTLALLIEKYAGAFPLWLSPEQVRILPIADRHNDFCEQICAQLRKDGIRVELDTRSEKIGFKIREAQLAKVPYMAVIGDAEVEAGIVAVRNRKGDPDGLSGQMSIEGFRNALCEEITQRRLG